MCGESFRALFNKFSGTQIIYADSNNWPQQGK